MFFRGVESQSFLNNVGDQTPPWGIPDAIWFDF